MNHKLKIERHLLAAAAAGATVAAGCYVDESPPQGLGAESERGSKGHSGSPGSGEPGSGEERDESGGSEQNDSEYEEIFWGGQGSDSEDCEERDPGEIHWVLTNPGGGITDAKLEIEGEEIPADEHPSNVFMFFTESFDVEDLEANGNVKALVKGDPSPNAQLVISSFCPAEEEDKKKKRLALKGKKSVKGVEKKNKSYALKDWKIEVYEYGKKSAERIDSTYTNKKGKWHIDLGYYKDYKDQKLAVCEKQYKGWKQIAPAESDEGTTVIDGRVCHLVTPKGSYEPSKKCKKTLVVGGLDFKNVAHGELSGYKYFDKAKKGVRTKYSPGIEGWPIEIYRDQEHFCTVATDADGAWTSKGKDVHTGEPCPPLVPGTYEIVESAPKNDKVWKQTGNVKRQGDAKRDYVKLEDFRYEVKLPAHQCKRIGDLNFGNICYKRAWCSDSKYVPKDPERCEKPKFSKPAL